MKDKGNPRGKSSKLDVEISLKEAYLGITRKLKVERREICRGCKGNAKSGRCKGCGVHHHSLHCPLPPEETGWELLTSQCSLAAFCKCKLAYNESPQVWPVPSRDEAGAGPDRSWSCREPEAEGALLHVSPNEILQPLAVARSLVSAALGSHPTHLA